MLTTTKVHTQLMKPGFVLHNQTQPSPMDRLVETYSDYIVV